MEQNLSAFADRVLEAAAKAGIAPAEVACSRDESFSVRVRKGEIEDYQVSDRISLTLRGFMDGRIGTSSTQALDEESIGLLVRGVIESAHLIETDEQDGILPPDERYGSVCNYAAALNDVTEQDKIALALDIDARLQGRDARITPDDTVVASADEAYCLKNTLGLDLSHHSNMLYAYTGDPVWAERLERVAFNALPATITEDMWAHQYVQMVNQIDCTPFPGKSYFRTNNSEAHRYGLEPNFGCCTANFGQGWPKLALTAFLRAGDGVVSAVPLPSSLRTEWKGIPVCVTLTTDYPFRNRLHYRVEAGEDTDMKLRVRIPSFARALRVNGSSHARRAELIFDGFRKGVNEIEISFETEPVLEGRPHGLRCLRRGSLIFSFPIEAECTRVEYTKKDVERKYPYCDYDYKGISDWNVAFAGKDFLVEECGIADVPFSESQPPLRIRAALCHIDWGLADGYETVCSPVPGSRKPLDEPAERFLIPYGCTRLRMTELPLV